MDYRRVTGQFYGGDMFYCDNTYESLIWYGDTEKPTDEHLCALYESVKDSWALDTMKHQRDLLLIQSDFRALPDYPNRDAWLVYRQLLRDMPKNWPCEYPISPI